LEFGQAQKMVDDPTMMEVGVRLPGTQKALGKLVFFDEHLGSAPRPVESVRATTELNREDLRETEQETC
jgi:hypothetical protein